MACRDGKRTIEDLVAQHEVWRSRCVNLIASENALSPAVKRYLGCDLAQRYGDYVGRNIEARKYRGTRWAEQIEEMVTSLAAEVYKAKYVELRAISGHIAGSAVIMGLSKPGDTILELGRDLGSHRMAYKLGLASAMSLKVDFLPFDPWSYNIDLPRAIEMVKRVRPRLVILGSSNFLFPHPVREMAAALEDLPETILAYDASHVLGLIAGGHFQDPLDEGARIVFGSTHKTLPGPQGGLILSNSLELMERVAATIYPAVVTNHHLSRLPALALALLEMKQWGDAYARQTIANAQRLAAAMDAKEVPVVSRDGHFTESHTILLRVASFGNGEDIANRLEQSNIIVTPAYLPEALGREGIRVGVQEITRLGAKEDDMAPLASLIAAVITGEKSPHDALCLVEEYASQFRSVHFTWE